MLTLLGPGGMGKTRLSLQTAADLLDEYIDGVFFLDLTVLLDPTHILSAIAEILNVREKRAEPILVSLRRHLQEKQLLLLLDNFEHIMEGVPVVGELLAAAPKVSALVTSREALRLSGEYTYQVPPLGLPEPGRPQAVHDLAAYESIESSPETGVFSYDLSTGAVTLITATSDSAARLDISPDGQLLAYDDKGLLVVSPDGGSPVRLTDGWAIGPKTKR